MCIDPYMIRFFKTPKFQAVPSPKVPLSPLWVPADLLAFFFASFFFRSSSFSFSNSWWPPQALEPSPNSDPKDDPHSHLHQSTYPTDILKWAVFKIPPSFHCTAWLIGIPLLEQYNSHCSSVLEAFAVEMPFNLASLQRLWKIHQRVCPGIDSTLSSWCSQNPRKLWFGSSSQIGLKTEHELLGKNETVNQVPGGVDSLLSSDSLLLRN